MDVRVVQGPSPTPAVGYAVQNGVLLVIFLGDVAPTDRCDALATADALAALLGADNAAQDTEEQPEAPPPLSPALRAVRRGGWAIASTAVAAGLAGLLLLGPIRHAAEQTHEGRALPAVPAPVPPVPPATGAPGAPARLVAPGLLAQTATATVVLATTPAQQSGVVANTPPPAAPAVAAAGSRHDRICRLLCRLMNTVLPPLK